MAHPLADQLAGITDRHERHRIKAEAFAALSGQLGRSVTRGRWTLTLTSAPRLADDLLVLDVRVDRDGADVTPPDLNPIRLYNPPVLVPDPAGDIVRTATSPVTGQATTLRFREDLAAALLSVIRDLVR